MRNYKESPITKTKKFMQSLSKIFNRIPYNSIISIKMYNLRLIKIK